MYWSVSLRKTAIEMMCRLVMPGLVISTNTVRPHKISPHVRILYPVLNQLKTRPCHSLKLRHKPRLKETHRGQKEPSIRRGRWQLMASDGT
uniref:Uncharacterized protein n=1 Tax=Myoviridae sp. ctnhb8 TaxID=2825171 RepID=A0A8S5VDY3_9CAUD|nr:MAG TPA: hypothetical protein [Myoviridae sp. ctnhb8]